MVRALRRNRLRLAVAATTALATVLTGLPSATGQADAAVSGAARSPARESVPKVLAYPGPGWTTASPQTTIVFRGATAAQLRPVRVVGSRSGVHTGSLVSSRTGVGAVFTPTRPFSPGEQVRVTAAQRVRGAASTTYTFGVAIPVRAPLTPPESSVPTARTGPSSSRSALQSRPAANADARAVHRCRPHVWHFRTAPRMHPVADCVTRAAVGTPRGLIFTTPVPVSNNQHGPTIFDNRGNIVWYHPMPYKLIYNLSVVTYHRQKLLAFMFRRKRGQPGAHRGGILLLNDHYQRVGMVTPKNGYTVDGHEFQLRGNSAWIGEYNPIIDPASGHKVYEYVVQEINIRTGDLLFEWHSLPHVPTRFSYLSPKAGQVWDYFHGNAIAPGPGGGFLLSARNTSAVYHISASGKVLWTMGGKHDTFRIAARHPGWQFCFQHDVRIVGRDRLTVFDNGGIGPGCPRHIARVEEFHYHPRAHTVARTGLWSSRRASPNGRGFFVEKLGSARFLKHGDLIVSWGDSGQITEFTRRHSVDFGLKLAERTYRGIRSVWFGDPTGRPGIAATRVGARVTVYASWNGSTRVGWWHVFAGNSRRHLHPVGPLFRRANFETRMHVRTRARFVDVRAIGVRGRRLGHSAAIVPR